MSGDKRVRNGKIDFLRFVFALVIVLHHSRYIFGYENSVFIGGSLGVDFFFLTSGYLMAATMAREDAARDVRQAAVRPGDATLAFLRKKIASFLPELIAAWGAGFCVAVCAQRLQPGQAAGYFSETIWEGLLLRMPGVYVSGFDGALWYLSSMLLCMALLYPLLRLFPDTGRKVFVPLTALLCYGYLCRNFDSPRDPTRWIGWTYKGNLRAYAELCTGVVLYGCAARFRMLRFNRFGRAALTAAEWGGYLLSIVYMYLRKPSNLDYFYIALLSGALLLTFSETGLDGALYRGGLCAFLGRYSLALYLSHFYWSIYLNELFPAAETRAERLALYLALAGVTALCVMGIAAAFRKYRRFVKRGLRRIFLAS